MRLALATAAVLAAGALPAAAASWQKCGLTGVVDGVRDVPQALIVTVTKVRPAKPGVECPAVGETLTFIPESADYQSSVPRSRYPTRGSTVSFTRIHLDGECKPDRPDLPTKPCRIMHFPTGW